MAYLHPFLRLVVSGTLYGSEQFSYGISLINDFGTGEAPTSVPTGVVNAVTTFHAATHVSHTNAKVNLLKLNLIGTDGRYVDQTDTVLHEIDPPVGGASTVNQIPQAATAITLQTAFQRGRASKGRFYVPCGAGIENDGRMAQNSTALPIAQAATTFLNSLNAALPGWDVGVVSPLGGGAQHAVTHVRVGRVVDTIRSRRISLNEEYIEGEPLAPA